jgi:hypothetical protein
MANTPKKPTRAELDRAAERLLNHYRHRENVTGADVGYIWKNGKKTKELGIRIHVTHKMPLSELESTQVFPDEFEGLPLDVIAGDYKPGLTSPEAAERSSLPILLGGISCGPIHQGAGTLGAMVIDEVTGQPSILSNWHVLAGPHGVPGAPITQAATLDGGDPSRDVVAELGRSILDIDGDAALAPLNGTRPWLPLINGAYDQVTSIRDPRLGETLTKAGRTTGTTEAVVDGEGLYRITYEVTPGRFEARTIRGFKLVTLQPGNPNDVELSGPGDSGSLWYHQNSKSAVGLHFAGETNPAPGQEHAIACNMTAVQRRLQFRIATIDDLLEAAAQPAMPQAGSSTSAAQYTPHPDWPEPSWPWGPYPIDGPWGPWPFPRPRGPIGPFGPYGPWGPRDPRGPLSDRGTAFRSHVDFGEMRDFGRGVTGVPAFTQRAGPERTTALRQVSVYSDIWPALQAALIAYGYTKAGSYTPQTPTSVLAAHGNPGTVLRIVIEQSNMFWNDGVRLHSADLRHLPRFIDVLYVLAQAYEQLGFVVVA